MNIVNEYRIKPNVTMTDIKKEVISKKMPWLGASTYIKTDVVHATTKMLTDDISVDIGFPEDLSTWDSYDHVLIMDESFGQPYYPFYEADKANGKRFPFVLNVIGTYNKLMDSFSFLERIKKDDKKEAD